MAGSDGTLHDVSLSFPGGRPASLSSKLWSATAPSCARLPVWQAANAIECCRCWTTSVSVSAAGHGLLSPGVRSAPESGHLRARPDSAAPTLLCLQIAADNILPFNVDEENLVLLSLRHISQALPHSSAYFRISDIKAASKQSTVYITLQVNRQVAQRNTGRSNREFHRVRHTLSCLFLQACWNSMVWVLVHIAVRRVSPTSAGSVPAPACGVLQGLCCPDVTACNFCSSGGTCTLPALLVVVGCCPGV